MINKIDYLLIDAEGHDLNIFESLTSDEHLKSCTLEFTYGNIERMCNYAKTLGLTSYEIFVYQKTTIAFGIRMVKAKVLPNASSALTTIMST
jgi:hypothetical protein